MDVKLNFSVTENCS